MENKELDRLLGESEEKLSEDLLDGENPLVNKVEEEEGKEELSDAPAETEEKENSEEKPEEDSKDKEEKSAEEDKDEKENSEEKPEEESKDEEEKSESEEKDEKKDELKEVNENMENIFDILKSLNEELSRPTEDKKPVEDKAELKNDDFYNTDTEEKEEDVEGIVVECLEFFEHLDELNESELSDEDIMLFIEAKEYLEECGMLSLTEAFEAGQGEKQQAIQKQAKEEADGARKSAVDKANELSAQANKAWSKRDALKNAFGRVWNKMLKNDDKVKELEKKRQEGLDKKNHLNKMAQGMVDHTYKENIKKIEEDRFTKQNKQNEKSLRSNLSQWNKKFSKQGLKGDELQKALANKRSELVSRQTTGEGITGKEIKKNGLLGRIFTGKTFREDVSDFELMQWLNENGYEPTFENVEILKEELIKNPNLVTEPETNLDNADIYNKETEPVKAEEVEGIVVECLEALEYISNLNEEEITDDDLLLFIEAVECLNENGLVSLNEANESIVDGEKKFTAGQGKKQQEIQQKAEDDVKKAREDSVNRANELEKQARKTWNFGSAAKNLLGRAWNKIRGNEEKLTQLRQQRQDALTKQSNLRNMAQNAVTKQYQGKVDQIEQERFKGQQNQNQKSVRSKVSQLRKKGLSDQEIADKKSEFIAGQTTGKAVTGEAIKKNGFFRRMFTGSTYREAFELSDLDLMNLLNENGFEPSIENLQILKEEMNDVLNTVIELNEAENPVVDKDPEEANANLNNADIYNKETEPVKAEDVKEVIVEAPIATVNHDTDGNPISGTYDDSPEAEATVRKKLEKGIHAEDKTTKNGSEVKHYIDPKNPDKEEVKDYIDNLNSKNENVKESYTDFELMKWLDENGYEPTFENVDILREELDNADIYNKETEPVKAEDVEPVDQPAQKDELPIEKSNEDKEYDVDEEYAAEKTAKVEPKDILKESVAYGSLKEALVLGTEYFTEDTYTLDTAEAKQAKLIEQVALSLGKESMDPIYDELLKSAVYTQRLQEALVEKYGKLAANKVNALMEADKVDMAVTKNGRLLTDKEIAEVNWIKSTTPKDTGIKVGRHNGEIIYQGISKAIDQQLTKQTIKNRRNKVENPGLVAAKKIASENSGE